MRLRKLYAIFLIPSCVNLLVASLDIVGDNENNSAEFFKDDIIITFKNDTTPVIAQFKHMNFATRAEKIRAFRAALVEHSIRTHGNIIGFITNAGLCVCKEMFLTGQLCLSSCVVNFPIIFDLLFRLFSHIILSIENAIIIPIPILDPKPVPPPTQPVLGISQTGAPIIWGLPCNDTGNGIIVANIDTGVRWTHITLARNFMGVSNFGWYDPCVGTKCPVDTHGHGTHTMGTIAGDKNIGMAPNARWIACRGCFTIGCPLCCLLRCAFWILCPDFDSDGNPKCEQTPNVVSNSWGGDGGSDFFQLVIEIFYICRIFVVFAAGNSGPSCNSVGSPGDNNKTCSVAATTFDGSCIAKFSSRGRLAEIEPRYSLLDPAPRLAAPGERVVSAGHKNDLSYVEMSGTSMATPHVAGFIALLLSMNKSLTYEQVFCLTTASACQPRCILEGKLDVCSGTITCINKLAGYGAINVPRAFNMWEAARKLCNGENKLNVTCSPERSINCETYLDCLKRLNSTDPGVDRPKSVKTIDCDCNNGDGFGFPGRCFQQPDPFSLPTSTLSTNTNILCCKC